jgi:hypothetical protein
MVIALIVVVVTIHGGARAMHFPGFADYESCEAFATMWTPAGLQSAPDRAVRWTCEIEEDAQ